MKTRTSTIWIPALVLLAAWLPGVLAQNEIDHSTSPAHDKVPMLAPISQSTKAVPPTTPVLPKIHLSPWTTEIVKLAQVGTEDSVMLSFIDNSGMFNLGADQIIYLSDLGVSSVVISEMLRHDAEVIAGVRQLTISSEPPQDTSMQIAFTASSSASNKADAQPVNTSASPDSMNNQLAAIPGQQPLLETNRDVANARASVFELAMMDESTSVRPEVLSQQVQSSGEKNGLYPVREPYPVQLTAPIFIVQTAEPTPNTQVIVLFPRTGVDYCRR